MDKGKSRSWDCLVKGTKTEDSSSNEKIKNALDLKMMEIYQRERRLCEREAMLERFDSGRRSPTLATVGGWSSPTPPSSPLTDTRFRAGSGDHVAQANTRVLGENLTNSVSWSRSRGPLEGGSPCVTPPPGFGTSTSQPMYDSSLVPPPGFHATKSAGQTDWAAANGPYPPVYGTSVGFDSKHNVNGLFTTAPHVATSSNLRQADWETHGFVPPMAFTRQHVGWENAEHLFPQGSEHVIPQATSKHSRKPLEADLAYQPQYVNTANYMNKERRDGLVFNHQHEGSPSNYARENNSLDRHGVNDLTNALFLMSSQINRKQAAHVDKRDLFDGNPLQYKRFIKHFDSYTARGVVDMSIRLDMLISSCTGDARDSIEDCIMASSPEAGYFEARRILEMNYGQEHAIVEAYVSKLTEGPPVRQNDAGALSRLARDMKNCEIACGGVSGAGLNTQHTVSRIFKRLPRYLQDKFMAEVSVQLERGCPITFAQLSAFLQKRVLVEKSFLGQLVNRRVDKTPTDNIGNQRRFGRKIGINTAQTTTERKEIPMQESCACCSEPHALWKCKRFGDKKESERRSLVKSAELCFNCLGRHKVRTCESRARCRHCEGKHHTLLHRESSKVAQGKGSPGESQEADGAGVTKQVMSASTLSQNASPRSSSSDDCSVACASEVKGSVRRDVRLKVVPIRVWSNANQRLENVYAFLDEGSDTSLCTDSLKNRLIAKGKAVTFLLSTINGTDCKRGQEVSLTVQGCGEQAVIDLPNVITVSELPELKSSIPVAQDTVTYADVLNGVTFPDFVGGVELLIGADVPAAHRTLECRISQRGGPDAVRTPLGWSLVGPTPQDRFADETNVTVSFVQTEDLQLHRQLQRMYESDFVASQDDPYSVTSVEDRKALGKMEGTIAKVEGHYQVALPWRSANPRLPNNKFVAVNRLNHLKKRLEKDPDLQRKYRDKIEEYSEQGYARRIPPGELAPTPKSWYLPHHATGPKFRIVFDCTARCKELLLAKSKGTDLATVDQASCLSVDELEGAELELIMFCQQCYFFRELSALSDHGDLGAITLCSGGPKRLKGSALARLCPIKVRGILRVGGRLQRSALPAEERHPIILPRRHHLTVLVILHYHVLEGHAGPLHTLAATRAKFWVVKGHATVRRVVGSCRGCRIRNAVSGKQIMAPLPSLRVLPGKPAFTCVGVDYAGPYFTKVGRRCSKRYICLFVCMATRAVHLECAHSLEMDSFLLAFHRFTSRRTLPEDVYSDNGANFVGAARELRLLVESWDKAHLQSKLARRGVRWHFNPPAASHQGGSWERIVRSVKRTLLAVAGGVSSMSDETFTTYLTEVERILNNRPITKVAADSRDAEALTPNALLKGSLDPSLPMGSFTKADGFRKSWRLTQLLADQFWSRWLRDYLPSLQQRQKWLNPERNLTVGDVVLVIGEHSQRGQWPKGLVEETYSGGDGFVRSARVRTAGGSVVRDVRKFCLLEAAD